MSDNNQIHHKKRIQEQACLWISRMDHGLSSTEKQELTIWINQDKSHHKMLLAMASSWDDISVLKELNGLFPIEKVPNKPRSKMFTGVIAASLLLVSLVGVNLLKSHSFLMFSEQASVVKTQTFKTRIGEQTSFTLSDGSIIQLNTNSIVTVAYTPYQRQLTLIRGEANFEVAKDKERPFTVKAGQQSFTALGTIFNVQKDNEQAMELLVTEGKVLITRAIEPLENITQAFKNPTSAHLPGSVVISGEKSVIANNQVTPASKISSDNAQRDLAWQQGILIFEGEPLDQVLNEVSRYTRTRFTLSNDELSSLKVAGYFKAGDINGLLASLNSNFNINYTRVSNNTIVLTSATY